MHPERVTRFTLLGAAALLIAVPGVHLWAAAQETEAPRYRVEELKDFYGWRAAERDPYGRAGGVILYKDLKVKEIRFIARAADISNPEIIPPPEPCTDVRRIVWQGDTLLASLADGKKAFRVAWRRMTPEGGQWHVSPSYPKCEYMTGLGMDRKGRIAGGSGYAPTVYYQEEIEGELKTFSWPVSRQGHFLSRIQAFVVENGDVWLAESPLRPYVNKPYLKGVVCFRDGKVQHVDLGVEAAAASVIPVGKHLLFVPFLGKKGVFIDSRDCEVLAGGPFDPTPFANQPVMRWSRAVDGTIWMVARSVERSEAHEREKKRGRYGQIWRWDGTKLEMISDGCDRGRTPDEWYRAPVAVSAEEIFVGCIWGGCFHFKRGKTQHIDWRHGLAAASIRRVHLGPDFILFEGVNKQHILRTRDVSNLAAEVSDNYKVHETLKGIELDTRGVAWTIVPEQPTPQFAFWTNGQWKTVFEIPVPIEKVSSFNFDSQNRIWVDEKGKQTDIWVRSDGSWIHYKSRPDAYKAEIVKCKGDLEVYFGDMFPPLFIGTKEIWGYDEWTNMHIFFDGIWIKRDLSSEWVWPGHVPTRNSGWVKKMRPAPFLGPDGHGRVLFKDKVMLFDGEDLVETDENAPQGVEVKPYRLEAELCRKDKRLKDASKIYCAWKDNNDIVWAAPATKPRLYGITKEIVEEFSLRGTPAVGAGRGSIRVAADGTVFLLVSQWLSLDFGIPEVKYKADIETGENAINLKLGEVNFPREKIDVRVRIDGGAWRVGPRLFPVAKGQHTIEMKCTLKDKLFRCAPLKKTVTVSGDLGKTLRTLIRKLGEEHQEERDAAERDLVNAGGIATPLLLDAADDPNPEIRSRIERILKKRSFP